VSIYHSLSALGVTQSVHAKICIRMHRSQILNLQHTFDRACDEILLYISYKTTFFSKHYSKVNSCSILMKSFPTEARTYIVFCDYFKIFYGSTDFKYSWFKHKLKLCVFKCTVIVLYCWRLKFSFVFKSWTRKYHRL